VIVEQQADALAMIRVAIVIAVDEVRSILPQIASSDRPAAHRAHGWRAGRSSIHQYESHVAPPSLLSAARVFARVRGGFRASGLPQLRWTSLAGAADIASPAIGLSDGRKTRSFETLGSIVRG